MSLEHGLYYELVRTNQLRRLIEEDEIRRAIFHPPATTRAFFRGRAVARFNHEIASIQWDEIKFQSNRVTRSVLLPHPAHNTDLERVNAAIRDAKTYAELDAALGIG